MRFILRASLFLVCVAAFASVSSAQQPGERPGERRRPGPEDGGANASSADTIVDRMLVFDKNKDGKLDRDEITDRRLLRLFDRADADKDKVVTKEELVKLAAQMAAEDNDRPRGGFGGPGGGPGDGPDGRRGRGPDDGPDAGPDGRPRGPGGQGGGPGGPGGFGPRPRPGQILPEFLRQSLNLSAEQSKQLDELQKDVDAKLEKILTGDQRKQLGEMRDRGPGGNGGPGGDRGPGGRGPGANGPRRDGRDDGPRERPRPSDDR